MFVCFSVQNFYYSFGQSASKLGVVFMVPKKMILYDSYDLSSSTDISSDIHKLF